MAAQTELLSYPTPGVDGMVTDVTPWMLGPTNTRLTVDGLVFNGVLRQRWGWQWDETQAPAPGVELTRVHRNKYVLAAAKRTVVIDTAGRLLVANVGAGGTVVGSGLDDLPHPRCVYQDQVVFVSPGGQKPALFYSGSLALDASFGAGPSAAAWTAGRSTLTASAGSWPADTTPGAYVWAFPLASLPNIEPGVWARVAERVSGTVLGLEDIVASGAGALYAGVGAPGAPRAYGLSYPCVNVYDEGTGSFAGGTTFTGQGVDFSRSGGLSPPLGADALLVRGQTCQVLRILAMTATTCTVATSLATQNTRYALLKRCSFRDVAAHKDSFFGAGVDQHPGRLYASPQGWNPAFPPNLRGAPNDPTTVGPVPWDPTVVHTSADEESFLLDEIDIPAAYDGDPIVALISTPGPLLVLKRASVYAVNGSYPNLEPSLVLGGTGCLPDVRGAVQTPYGAYWAADDGVYTFDGTRAVNLMEDRVRDEWRTLVRKLSWGAPGTGLSMEVTPSRHLLVGFMGIPERGYVCDLTRRAWSRINLPGQYGPRGIHTSYCDDVPRTLMVGISGVQVPNTYTTVKAMGTYQQVKDAKPTYMDVLTGGVSSTNADRIIDLAPAYRGLKQDGTPADARDGGTDVSYPSLEVQIPIARNEVAKRQERLMAVQVRTNLLDTGAVGASEMTVSSRHVGHVDSYTEDALVAGTIPSDPYDLRDRVRIPIGIEGREHRIDVRMTTISPTFQKAELHELAVELRPRRGRR